MHQAQLPEGSARRRGSQGTTTVRFLIDTDGSAAQFNILKSSGDSLLDGAARSALSKSRFKPAVKNGQPQRAWARAIRLVIGPRGQTSSATHGRSAALEPTPVARRRRCRCLTRGGRSWDGRMHKPYKDEQHSLRLAGAIAVTDCLLKQAPNMQRIDLLQQMCGHARSPYFQN
jgi:TonB family protein